MLVKSALTRSNVEVSCVHASVVVVGRTHAWLAACERRLWQLVQLRTFQSSQQKCQRNKANATGFFRKYDSKAENYESNMHSCALVARVSEIAANDIILIFFAHQKWMNSLTDCVPPANRECIEIRDDFRFASAMPKNLLRLVVFAVTFAPAMSTHLMLRSIEECNDTSTTRSYIAAHM